MSINQSKRNPEWLFASVLLYVFCLNVCADAVAVFQRCSSVAHVDTKILIMDRTQTLLKFVKVCASMPMFRQNRHCPPNSSGPSWL